MLADSPSRPIVRPNLKVAIVGVDAAAGETGGAERLCGRLRQAFADQGYDAHLITVPGREGDFDEILANYEYCRKLDLSAYDLVVSTKAPTFAVRHSRHVTYLVHTIRVFSDMFDQAFPDATAVHYEQRARVHALDLEAFSGAKAHFAIGHEVANRLFRWHGIKAQVLYPPIALSGLGPGKAGDYFFVPGRLHPWKRVDLLIDAVKASSAPLKLVISGTGEQEDALRERANDDERIEFVGRVSDERLVELYSNALAVPFVPIGEDYGYVTLEAFASGKAVITCTDSGEPTRLVRHGETGLIADPNAASLRQAMDWVVEHRDRAQEMGMAGAELVAGMSWAAVVKQLLEADPRETPHAAPAARVSVLDMQPITPAVGGGRLRLLGLYHGLGQGIHCRYVGSYDWPGEARRQIQISDGLAEIDVPLSVEHHIAAQALSEKAAGKTVIDITFGRLGKLSPEYVATAVDAVRWADVVIFSHPWAYPLVRDALSPNHLVIYDAHNVEGYLRAQLLENTNPLEAELLRHVVEDEYEVGSRADLIFVCSQEDLERFHRVYEFPYERLRVVPNGVMAFARVIPDSPERLEIRRSLSILESDFVAIFIGSAYKPNVEAAQFIIDELSVALPDVLFVIAGGVSGGLTSSRSNVRLTGAIDDDERHRWLAAADIAVNPMFSGSGTNIKMFDYMAYGLSTVATEIGARGINTGAREAILVTGYPTPSVVAGIQRLRDPSVRESIGAEARACIEDSYAWERISATTGHIITAHKKLVGQSKPTFSVIVPTYERHGLLDALMKQLQLQVERSFEVIVVDQSNEPWSEAGGAFGFPLVYVHEPVRGAGRARNTGASVAQGRFLAFTDDDCLPDPTWLLNARAYFAQGDVAGIEGTIISDHLGDPAWRPVTNVGFEGLGFMTANLIVRAEHFIRLGGFDLSFDHPHFREDTDFGWRLQAIGRVPYAWDVSVVHPAQRRSLERESASVRARFFENDALLYRKHPSRYRELFVRERHLEVTPEFVKHLRLGFERHRIVPPDWIRKYIDAE